jgi:hypothetical protein
VALTFASFLALVAGLYRLGRIAFTPLVGAIAAARASRRVGRLAALASPRPGALKIDSCEP